MKFRERENATFTNYMAKAIKKGTSKETIKKTRYVRVGNKSGRSAQFTGIRRPHPARRRSVLLQEVRLSAAPGAASPTPAGLV